MNIFAKFDENPAITLQVIKKTKHYGQTHGRMEVKTVYPTTNKVCGGYNKFWTQWIQRIGPIYELYKQEGPRALDH